MEHNLRDKNGVPIIVGNETTDDDVLFDGEHYHRIYEHINTDNSPTNIEMISCTFGYTHAVTQQTITDFTRIGKYKDNESLFECD